jgi:hypothetical protein
VGMTSLAHWQWKPLNFNKSTFLLLVRIVTFSFQILVSIDMLSAVNKKWCGFKFKPTNQTINKNSLLMLNQILKLLRISFFLKCGLNIWSKWPKFWLYFCFT